MRKVIISVFVIIAFAIYSLHSRSESAEVAATTTSLQAKTSASGLATSSPSAASTASTSSASQYKDGTYTGDSADAYYGFIKVRVTISGGKLTDVEFLQYPNDHHESVQINSSAMPILKQEAITAQSDQVDGVSGATDTSQAFIESLSSALSQARA